MSLKSVLESMASQVLGRPMRLMEDNDFAAALALLRGKDWDSADQVALVVALTKDRVEQQVVEGTEDKAEPEYEDVVISRTDKDAAMAIVYEVLTHVENEQELVLLARNVLGGVGYGALRALAHDLVVRLEESEKESAVTSLNAAAAKKARAERLVKEAEGDEANSKVASDRAGSLGKAKSLI